MDILWIQSNFEQTLNFVQEQGPGAMQQLLSMLSNLQSGAMFTGSIATLVTQYPNILATLTHLSTLIGSGASIAEISAAISEAAITLGMSVEALGHLLTVMGGAIALL